MMNENRGNEKWNACVLRSQHFGDAVPFTNSLPIGIGTPFTSTLLSVNYASQAEPHLK